MRLPLALALALMLGTPGCASAIASALGATGGSAAAARELDGRMFQAAVRGLSSGGETHTTAHAAPDRTTFGGEPSFVCAIPSETERQTIAASSLEGALRSCRAMNAMSDDDACTCREAELGSALAGPIAER